jgi:superfamily II DNA or RNA helicase
MVAKNMQQDRAGKPPVLEVSSECVLRSAPESLRAAIREQLTVNNPKYMDAKRYSRWVGKQLKPKLYFFREQGSTLIFPRGYGNRAVRLCRNRLGVVPEIVDRRRKLIDVDFSFAGELRPYQQQAVLDVVQRSFGVLEAGTGSGKTVMALKVIAERRQPTIIIVHSRELLHQWMERIDTFLGISAGQAGGGRFDLQPVTVAIVNTARKRLEELTPLFGQIIVDECHRVPASLFTGVVTGFDAFYMLGLSATAFRREDGMTKLIYTYMGDRVHAVDAKVLADSGAVVRPDFIQHETGFSYGYRGEYAKLIKALAKNEERNTQIAADIGAMVRKGHSGTVLVVSDRVAHCEVLSRKLQQGNVETELLTGRTPSEQRVRIVQQVQDGQVQVLLSTLQLIGEGFDCSGLSTLVLATPIKFEGRLLQVVGRIMRPAEGKKALVIDYVDVKIPVLRRSAAARTEMFSRWRGEGRSKKVEKNEVL